MVQELSLSADDCPISPTFKNIVDHFIVLKEESQEVINKIGMIEIRHS